MLQQDDILADLHTHTLYSMHAFSTLYENMQCARAAGIHYLAVTDHYYGTGDRLAIKNENTRLKQVQRELARYDTVPRIIGGAEFNLGQVPVRPSILEKLVWRPIGLHSFFMSYSSVTAEGLYGMFRDAADQGYNAFAHIERKLHVIEDGRLGTSLGMRSQELLRRIVRLAAERHIFLEVNEASLSRNEPGARERMTFWLREAKRCGCRLSLGTDAHYCEAVGRFPNAVALLDQIDYPKSLILNCDRDLLEAMANGERI